MLKALELIGFKSFADKTRFEFPEGITVVVGPNGSGKSNIVDAIKWVLGEQSVKSLRGKEMADVIFNGSGARRAMNCAEAMLTFDNRDSRLPIDSEEVHVGRRVYRSGEGEYLINGQPSRLRDVRDLFAGTGVSTQAYSIIEQGKVDVLLQSSPRDRRLIFEEAAGISRFKAKKLDAIRRLDRVEQNLLRMTDIIDEVDGRLRTVRSQASKARRYKQYTDRLQELRTQVGLTDWRQLTEKLELIESELATLREEVVSTVAQAETSEVRVVELEAEVSVVEDELRSCEGKIARQGERIAACESSIQHERTRGAELETETEHLRDQIAATTSRADDLTEQLTSTSQAVEEAKGRHQQIATEVADCERELTEITERFDHIRQESDIGRAALTERLRDAGQLGNDISAIQTRIETIQATQRRSQESLGLMAEELADATEQFEASRLAEQETSKQLAEQDAKWASVEEELSGLLSQRNEVQDQISELSTRLAGAQERSAVLEDLERRQEGIASAVKKLLLSAQSDPDGPLGAIRGLVVDVLPVDIEMAPLIEIALSDKAGYLVVESREQLDAWLQSPAAKAVESRVGLVQLESFDGHDAAVEKIHTVDLHGQRGIVGRADEFVDASPEYKALAARLLGQTWVVETLTDALVLADTHSEVNFVTRDGDTVSRDGSVCVGPRTAIGGLVSRRSELRALAARIVDLQTDQDRHRGHLEQMTADIAQKQRLQAEIGEDRDKIQKELSNYQIRVRTAEERQALIEQQQAAVQGQLSTADQELTSAHALLEESKGALTSLEEEVTRLEAKLGEDTDELDKLDQLRTGNGRSATLAKVELAKSEQQLDHLQVRMQQFEQDQQERQRTVEQSQQKLTDAVEKAQQSQRRILEAESEVAELYLRKEESTKETVELGQRREQLRQERNELMSSAQQLRSKSRKMEEQIHQQDLAAGEVRHQRETLAQRLREDYEIELAELEHEPTDEEQHEREVVEDEISELRRKINNIGNVNLEALEELDQLEDRFAELSTQHDDLSEARKSLETIIERINEDSRRLFTETLETVREHFRELFRKLFGGGQADIIIEDDIDILESGLEIVARPPGKEPRSISLLSGGEKTLTCVALLLAIFRSKPSPFCVLDEVDAALDEANIERFIGVLDEFLEWTQFIVVTHSKKTMTSAGTLYGVTMQESGISKRVSVRFDDVSETGEIRQSAVDREEQASLPQSQGTPPEADSTDDETQAA